jgi:hypothetical protein
MPSAAFMKAALRAFWDRHLGNHFRRIRIVVHRDNGV